MTLIKRRELIKGDWLVAHGLVLLPALLTCDVVSLFLLYGLLDSADTPTHEMACVIHEARVRRVIERGEGESPSDLALISSV